MQLSLAWQWWHDQKIATFVLLDWTVVVRALPVGVGDVLGIPGAGEDATTPRC